MMRAEFALEQAARMLGGEGAQPLNLHRDLIAYIVTADSLLERIGLGLYHYESIACLIMSWQSINPGVDGYKA
jgi:hypothetical protein